MECLSDVLMSFVFDSREDRPHFFRPDLFDLGKAALPEGLELRCRRFVAIVSTCFGTAEVVHISLDPTFKGWLHGCRNLASRDHLPHVRGPVMKTRQIVLVVWRPYFISVDEDSLGFNRAKATLVEGYFFAAVEVVNGGHTYDVVGTYLETRFPVVLQARLTVENARTK